MRGVFMKILLTVAAIVVAVIYSVNINRAAKVLCRVAGGFAFLYIYNSVAYGLPLLGINVISAAVCGILGLPGLGLLICLGLL